MTYLKYFLIHMYFDIIANPGLCIFSELTASFVEELSMVPTLHVILGKGMASAQSFMKFTKFVYVPKFAFWVHLDIKNLE